MSKNVRIKNTIDLPTLIYFLILVIMGWISIYGASYNFDQTSFFDFSQRSGAQIIWILTAFALGGVILLIDDHLYDIFAYFFYGAIILLLIFTIIAPTSIVPAIKGSRSWIVLGAFRFQPAELAKIATALALAKYMSNNNTRFQHWREYIPVFGIILLPLLLIIFEKETGSALVFMAFLLMFYREGMTGVILVIIGFSIILFVLVIRLSNIPIQVDRGTLGFLLAMLLIFIIQIGYAFFFTKNKKEVLILLASVAFIFVLSYFLNIWYRISYNKVSAFVLIGTCIYWAIIELINRYKKFLYLILFTIGSVIFSFSADYLFEKILEPHQQIRIKVLLNMEDDLTGAGYNVNQSKIAIGSGGFLGKGFLNGTQTKLKYVPEQDTDFIFCTVGEEHGFLGSTVVLILFWLLLIRILKIAERQRESFNRIYAYCVAGILFFHLTINVGMVLGIMPVIGIPLPFFSYGGSSLWGFTILLFILLRLDAARMERMI